jgi:hypothetical protein
MSTFMDIKKQYKILTVIREDLIGIRNIFDEKTKECHSLKYDIRRGGLSGKYKELELVECIQNIELIRIEFEKKHKEFESLRMSIDPSKILDLRYLEIKQKEYELLDKYTEDEKILKQCEEKELSLEQVCAEYEEIKMHSLVLNNRSSRYDYGNTLYKKNMDCLKRIKELEKETIIHRQLYELQKCENAKKKEEINKEMAEFFQICEALDEEIVLEEGILI